MLKMEIREYYKNNYQQAHLPFISLPHGAFKKIGRDVLAHLDMLLDDTKIKEDVWSCDSLKAPGYNGFNMKFVKECWDIIGKDIIQFIKGFFEIGKFDHAINTTWVTFIPKISNPCSSEEYRPIGVVRCFTKS